MSEQYDEATEATGLTETPEESAPVTTEEDAALEAATAEETDESLVEATEGEAEGAELDADESGDDPVETEPDEAPVDEALAAAEELADEAAEELADEPEPSVEEAEADAEVEDDDPLEAFRRELWAKPGDWFVVHTYSGMENRVKSNLENRIISLNMEDYIHEIVVPTEEVAEIKNGQRKMVKRTVLPGYVLVRMDLTDESWAAVRHTPSVTGFVGHSHQPVPLSMSEVENMLAPSRGRQRRGRGRCRRPGRRRRRDRRPQAGRGRRLRRLRLGDGRRRPVRHAARDDHRDQRRVAAGEGPRRDLRPRDPGRAELQPDPEGLSGRACSGRSDDFWRLRSVGGDPSERGTAHVRDPAAASIPPADFAGRRSVAE